MNMEFWKPKKETPPDPPTNRRWLESLSDKELAEFLTCGLYVHSLYPCEGNVPISQDYVVTLRMVTGRYTQSHLGLAEWLKSEQEYEVIRKESGE